MFVGGAGCLRDTCPATSAWSPGRVRDRRLCGRHNRPAPVGRHRPRSARPAITGCRLLEPGALWAHVWCARRRRGTGCRPRPPPRRSRPVMRARDLRGMTEDQWLA